MNPGAVSVDVDDRRCIRCGACAALAPRVFEVTRTRTMVLAAPAAGEESLAVTIAALVCPTLAIRHDRSGAADAAAAAPAPLYPRLARQSERSRGALGDVDWSTLRAAEASPPLRTLARQMAFSELATYSATQRFMQAFGEDVDFSQWLSIWFYEETRHPHLLSEWLARLGEPLDDDFALRGRVSTPFMKSLMGTLVTNLVSEVTASAAYAALGQACPEPVLAQIGRIVAGDEARHAAAFFLFARRRMCAADDPAREQLDALKVLHFWLNEQSQVSHPLNQMLERLAEADGAAGLARVSFDQAAVKRRVTRIIAGLVGCAELRGPDDVMPVLKRLTHERQHGTSEAAGT